jgi:hypothetical protein
VSNENADAQYNDNSSDSSKHKQLPTGIVLSNQGPGCTVKGNFIELLKFDLRLRIFSNGAVASPQLNFCSCFGTTNFDLPLAQRGLSFRYRGGVDFIAINF